MMNIASYDVTSLMKWTAQMSSICFLHIYIPPLNTQVCIHIFKNDNNYKNNWNVNTKNLFLSLKPKKEKKKKKAHTSYLQNSYELGILINNSTSRNHSLQHRSTFESHHLTATFSILANLHYHASNFNSETRGEPETQRLI